MNTAKNPLTSLNNVFNRIDGAVRNRLIDRPRDNRKNTASQTQQAQSDRPRPDWYEATHGSES